VSLSQTEYIRASRWQQIEDAGFAIINDIYSEAEIETIVTVIEIADQSKVTFRKTDDLFAIRRFLCEIPGVKNLIFNEKLKSLIRNLFGNEYFIVKSIYFDKPERSNWFVAWHQDLTIAVDKKSDLAGYAPWTVKLDNFAVQPPVAILQENFTIRIHLDDTDENNGALKVITGSHYDVLRAENINPSDQEFCPVKAGGVMIMRPLLMHASERSTNNQRRRVIHIEFGKAELPEPINWAEKETYN
jgi:ectoine hydroxylase-related dioxygenase (phytanoyl-CoA dioxygenase family)